MQAQIYDTNGDYVQTFVGSGIPGYLDGQGQQTEFSSPSQVVADSSSNLYVWDSGNHLIRKVTATGTVSTFVGGGMDSVGYGTNVSLQNYSVAAMAMDNSNIIWLVALGTNTYPSMPYLLNVSTNAYLSIANGGSGLSNLTAPTGICFDSANNLYYSGGNRIYRYNPTSATLRVFAGSVVSGYLNGNGIFTEFSSPTALACDQANNIYVWDSENYRVRRIDQSQNVTTIAGNNSYLVMEGNVVDGTGTNASFNDVSTMFSDDTGDVFFACATCVRKMDAQTNVVTIAGSFTAYGSATGEGAVARFSGASGLCLSQGMILVADSGNECIRQISFNAVAQPVSGPNLALALYPGLQITGVVGRTYQIQWSTDMSTWNAAATLLLTSSPYLWFDTNSIGGNKFYRAFLLP